MNYHTNIIGLFGGICQAGGGQIVHPRGNGKHQTADRSTFPLRETLAERFALTDRSSGFKIMKQRYHLR